jgi:hypothetical protein
MLEKFISIEVVVKEEVINIDSDEGITPMDTNNTPQVDIQGPITHARARQLNL